jgi:hypothetical protein
MKKIIIIPLIVAAVLILAGGGIFLGAMAMTGWDIRGLGNKDYVSKTIEIKDDFSDISVEADVSDLIFKSSDDGRCKVEFYEEEGTDFSADVKGKTLEIDAKNNDHFSFSFFSFENSKIVVYLTEDRYSDLDINDYTGDVTIPEAFSFKNITVKGETGDISCSAKAAGLSPERMVICTGFPPLMPAYVPLPG